MISVGTLEHTPSEGHPGDWRLHDSDLVRAAAAVLIANSHLEPFYPRSWMAGDGLAGNALFFFLSGYGVALAGRSRAQGFGRWYGRRAGRLYPAVIVAGLVVHFGLLRDWHGWSARDVWAAFAYPTDYGYVGHIMIAYAALFWLLRPASRWPLAVAAMACGCATVGFYVAFVARYMSAGEPLMLGQTSKALHWFYFTGLVLAGALFGPSTRRPRGTPARDLGLLAGVFAAYVGLKYEMVSGHGARAFLLLHAMVAILCPLAVRVSADDRLQAWVRAVRPLRWAVSLVAAATLEMYIVQTWTHVWPRLIAVRFPWNLAEFWVATVAGAVVLRWVTRGLVRAVGGAWPASRARAATG